MGDVDGIDNVDDIDNADDINNADNADDTDNKDSADNADSIDSLKTLAKNIKSIENSVARYIYKKYIVSKSTIDENENEKEKKIKTIDNTLYRIYLQTIFNLERKTDRILQSDVLKQDKIDMDIANKAYDINPKSFKQKDYKSLPDILRCTFIRKYKHRYYRCKNKVINDDSDICKQHENSDNIYIDKYDN